MRKFLALMIIVLLAVGVFNCIAIAENDEKQKAETKSSVLPESQNNESAQHISIGDTLIFGKYEQDRNNDNGPEDVEWIVLDVQDGKCLLLSKCGLDAIPYNESDDIYLPKDSTWAECTLRKWLNNDFYTTAFSSAEKSHILVTKNDNTDSQGNNEWTTHGGKNTSDRIFLLSHNEVFNQYLGSSENAECLVTPYAVSRGAISSPGIHTDGKLTCGWWLRSPGLEQNHAEYVAYYATGVCEQSYTVSTSNGVRPALWVKTKGLYD